MNGEESYKVLRRKVTPEIWKSRMKDTEEVLDNYRENLHNHGVTDEKAIEQFVAQEREKMYREYESLDRGELSSNTYHTPTNWESIAESMKEQEMEEDYGMSM